MFENLSKVVKHVGLLYVRCRSKHVPPICESKKIGVLYESATRKQERLHVLLKPIISTDTLAIIM